MDLDNIKKDWQGTNFKPTIDEEKIIKMVDNKGQSALARILRYEKMGAVVLLFCIPLGYGVFSKYWEVLAFYILSAILGLTWQVCKIGKLKKIDMLHQGITEISGDFYWYRKAMIKEFTIGLIWFVAFAVIWGGFELVNNSEHFLSHWVVFVVTMSIGFLLVIWIYKKLYWNNMKKIEDSIKEVEEFEKDNIE
ncbi:hypothetical protein [Dysgonomonas sp. 511]|uniref:hypothetical protein n=1 Tax=Dysgonomonas sp. 511 TaxID=2302930 RepID=UPI0013D3A025|nr:hypothetical protein [Dysgonomonas sp. 511]NDV78174.1 hypothetical protein [Dysgonomonas sp. 511]